MYCPVDGDEFREGITRCPEHDVDLVADPPEVEASPSWMGRFGDVRGLRVVVAVGAFAGIVYGTAGAISGILYALILRQDDFGGFPNDSWALRLEDISRAAFPVVIGAVGILGAALLFRAYTNAGPRRIAADVESEGGDGERPRFATELMRVLFVLSIVFILLWAVTGILTAKDQAEYLYGVATQLGTEGPEDSFITLTTLNNLAYYAGTTCLLLMGVRLALTAYVRLDRR